MPAAERLVLVVGVLLRIVVMAGLWKRGRVRRVPLLLAYLAVTALTEGTRLAFPDTARDWNFWIARQVAAGALVALVVLDVSRAVFVRLPGAAARSRRALLLVVAATVLAVYLAPGIGTSQPGASWRFVLVTQVLPRLAFGTVGLCLATLFTMALHLVPLDPLHRVVLLGLSLYLTLYAGTLGAAADSEWGRFLTYHVTPLVHVAVLASWAYAAWRREDEPPARPEVVKALQPWR